jgi:hypothetical protein
MIISGLTELIISRRSGFELENQYSNLSNCSELSSPGLPKATSSPNKETKLKSDKNEHKKKIGNPVISEPMKSFVMANNTPPWLLSFVFGALSFQ